MRVQRGQDHCPSSTMLVFPGFGCEEGDDIDAVDSECEADAVVVAGVAVGEVKDPDCALARGGWWFVAVSSGRGLRAGNSDCDDGGRMFPMKVAVSTLFVGAAAGTEFALMMPTAAESETVDGIDSVDAPWEANDADDDGAETVLQNSEKGRRAAVPPSPPSMERSLGGRVRRKDCQPTVLVWGCSE